MPGFRTLKHSGIHRFQTCSLFRTLLRATRHELLPEHTRNVLQVAVKDKFHKNHHAQGYHVYDATTLGHKVVRVLKTLRSASEITKPVTRLVALVNQLYSPGKICRIQEARLEGRRKHEEKLARKAAAQAREATKGWHVYDRPMPKEMLAGRRKVPDYVVTSGYPFLRYAKPQPPFLSGMLRYKANRHQKYALWHQRLVEEDKHRALDEDQWDKILIGILGKDMVEDDERFINAVNTGIAYTMETLNRDAENRNRRADRLFEVHLKEKELARAEREEAKQAKRQAREGEHLDPAKERDLIPSDDNSLGHSPPEQTDNGASLRQKAQLAENEPPNANETQDTNKDV